MTVSPATLRRRLTTIGPGIVLALTILGPSDLVTNAAAGATHGYALIWVFALALLFRFVWLGASAKYVLVTGESLIEGYARLGRWMVPVLLLSLVLVRLAYNLMRVVLIGSAIHLIAPLPFTGSAQVWAIVFVTFGFVMMVWGGYPWIERFCRALMLALALALLLAAALADPQPLEILRGTFVPSIPSSAGAYSTILLVTALVGAGAGSLTNVTYSYFLQEKGWHDASDLPRQRFDLAVGISSLFLLSASIQVIAAGTLQGVAVPLESTQDLVQVLSGRLGQGGRIILALGLWASAFSGYVAGTSGYGLILTDIGRSYIPRLQKSRVVSGGSRTRDSLYRVSVAFWSFAPLYALFTSWKPVGFILVSTALVLLVVPLLAWGLLRLTSDRTRMGAHCNNWWTNVMLTGLIVVSLVVLVRGGIEWVSRLLPGA